MRYAIYFTPPADDPLVKQAETWLGWSAFQNETVPLAHEQAEHVKTPAKYGFHGTLKAPFRLASGKTEAELVSAFEEFCAVQQPFDVEEMKIARIGPFFAYVPGAPCVPLEHFAEQALKVFEPFRAPLNAAELEKRNPSKLSPRQREHLDKWGYPYVLDEFRFHMTLTGPVPEEKASEIETLLCHQFVAQIGQTQRFNSCGIYIQESPERPFRIHTFKRLGL